MMDAAICEAWRRGGVMKIMRAAVVPIVVAGVAAGVAYGALPLTGRVLHGGELAGMKPSGPVGVSTGASGWVSTTDIGLPTSGQKADVARLRKLGFIAGVDENLVTAGNQNGGGLSAVEQFSSAKSAKAELAYESTANGPWTYFSVHGIPGARGFEALSTQGNGRNVAFTSGVYYYIVGAGWSGGSSNAVSRSTLAAVALVLYHRVHDK
jgi:hypothetical protein